jgi:hypothetical protein
MRRYLELEKRLWKREISYWFPEMQDDDSLSRLLMVQVEICVWWW